MHLALLLFFLSSSLASPCPPGWWLAQDNNCFRFLASETDLSWMEATQTCEQEGGFLAEPKTPGQMEFLSELAYTYEETTGVSSWWIGASDSGHEGRWTWGQSGEEVPDEFWAKGSPSSDVGNHMDCATIQLVGTELFWVDMPCGKEKAPAPPVCQLQIETSTTTTPATTTTTTSLPPPDCTAFCKGQEDGLYSPPDHCCSDSYCFCINGRGSLGQCDSWDQAFCEAYGTCVDSETCLSSTTGCCPHSDSYNCPETGLAFNGRHASQDVGNIPNIFSWQDCGNACSLVDDCLFWTYDPHDLGCYMSHSDAGAHSAELVYAAKKGCK